MLLLLGKVLFDSGRDAKTVRKLRPSARDEAVRKNTVHGRAVKLAAL